jgi:hypothetical protein
VFAGAARGKPNVGVLTFPRKVNRIDGRPNALGEKPNPLCSHYPRPSLLALRLCNNCLQRRSLCMAVTRQKSACASSASLRSLRSDAIVAGRAFRAACRRGDEDPAPASWHPPPAHGYPAYRTSRDLFRDACRTGPRLCRRIRQVTVRSGNSAAGGSPDGSGAGPLCGIGGQRPCSNMDDVRLLRLLGFHAGLT